MPIPFESCSLKIESQTLFNDLKAASWKVFISSDGLTWYSYMSLEFRYALDHLPYVLLRQTNKANHRLFVCYCTWRYCQGKDLQFLTTCHSSNILSAHTLSCTVFIQFAPIVWHHFERKLLVSINFLPSIMWFQQLLCYFPLHIPCHITCNLACN